MNIRFPFILSLTLVLLGFVSNLSAAETYLLEFGSKPPRELEMSVGKSQIITSKSALDQVVIGSPAVADIKLLSSTQVLILGMKPGYTNLVFRTKDNRVTVMDVVVGYDIGQVKKKLYEVLPEEKSLEIRASNHKVILGGQVSSLIAMEEVLSVARSYVPEANIVNLIQVGGGHQVMLEVRIAEVSRNNLRDLGIESTFSDMGSNIVGGTIGSSPLNTNMVAVAPFPAAAGTSMVSGLSPKTTPYLNIAHGSTGTLGIDSLKMTLTALERRGLADLLAEPNLTALSGQEASFLAGGEVAIPVAQSTLGAITIDYKEFGIGLKFTPVVLDKNRINIKLNTEVSSIDNANSVQAAGFIIPAISTRRTGTTVEIGDGQSFAIAGLLESDMRNVINEVPGLGRIPILGALFRSTSFQKNETELVIVVTPRIVKPTTLDQLKFPTDVVLAPNMLDQYLFGLLEHYPGKKRSGEEEKDSTEEESEKSASAINTDGQNSTDRLKGSYGHQI